MILKLLFWIFFFILVYAYIGYPAILFVITRLKRLFNPEKSNTASDYEPDVCLFVTAYNEKDFIRQKVENSFQLDYPKEKVQYVWVTDGSDDGTPDFCANSKTSKFITSRNAGGKCMP
jgi:cellulose synthase/poly-beta-1,6-N-acetylglucosamine synthase-like glycosyltransferase